MRITRWVRRLFGRERFPVDIAALEDVLGHHFSKPSLLVKGLTHRSYSQEVDGNSIDSNERLEFLGDSVLNMVVAHAVFARHPRSREGDLTKLKSALVSKTSAEKAALKAGLDRFILLSESEEGAGGRLRASILADAYEAVLGALFIDGGIEPARRFVERTILDNVEVTNGAESSNYKSRLLELT
jgi:ribonuclease III